MCRILKMTDCRDGRKFGTRTHSYCICRVLCMSDSLCSVWGHSVHFAKFLMLTFSESCNSYNFYPISTKLEKSCNLGKNRPLVFLAICQILSVWYFEGKLFQPHCHYPSSGKKGQSECQGPWHSCFFSPPPPSLDKFASCSGKFACMAFIFGMGLLYAITHTDDDFWCRETFHWILQGGNAKNKYL